MPFDPHTQRLTGAHSIEASAGTGKTYSITLLWLRLLIEHGLKVEEILVSTFTKAATAELKERLLVALRNALEAVRLLQNDSFPEDGPEAKIVARHLESSREPERPASQRLGELSLHLTEALSGFDLAPISTIHGFCQTLIARHSIELGCDSGLRLVEDTTSLLQPLVDDQAMRMSATGVPKYDALLKIAQASASQTADERCFGDNQEGTLAKAIADRFPKAKLDAGVRGYDDIVKTVHDALSVQGENGALALAVRKRLRAAIIDECQDSDGAQIGVFEALFLNDQTLSFIVIGDPKQSIYRFRGADLASYKRLAARAQATSPMQTNHRSDGPLIEALNALYTGTFTFPDNLNPDAPTQYTVVEAAEPGSRIADPDNFGALVFQWNGATKREFAKSRLAEQVAAECHRLLSAGVQIADRHSKQMRPLTPGDIAVLAGGHKDLQLVRQKLTQVGIPSQASGKGLGSVFGSDEARDILAWLQLYAALERRGNVLGMLLAFLGTPLGGEAPEELYAIQTSAEAQAKRCEAFRSELAPLSRSGPLPLLLKRLGQQTIVEANLDSAEGERRMTNWRQIGSLLQHEHGRGRRGAAALALWLGRLTASAPESTNDDPDSNESALMKLETDSPTVQLVTIHSSKGLEYPVVFCPFLWDVRSVQKRRSSPFALRRTQNGWLLDVGSQDLKENLGVAMTQEDEEEHRKIYVALTRARHRLYLGLAPVKEGSASHKNGADQSGLTHLAGLGLNESNDPSAWEDALSRFPLGKVQQPEAAPDAASARRSLLLPPPLDLLQPTALPAYAFPLQRTNSFSSLARTDQEDHASADRDSDQSRAPHTPEDGVPNMLAGLGDAGPVLGDQLHSALEDFLGNRKDLKEAVGYFKNAELWEQALGEILDTSLQLGPHTPVCLRALRESCITEMQFHLPVDRLEPQALSAAILKDPGIEGESELKHWAAGIANWGFGDFSGYFQGFIDLIFEHEGRWFVADYKSNLLKDYAPGALRQAMLEHHYLLQARFYALALHRHLQCHLEGYDFERHFGGVAYLFVRGFPKQGLWFERPSRETIEHLGAPFQSTRP
jgi:exodeoxyribonuclease V beta subunit